MTDKQFTCPQCEAPTRWNGKCNACIASDYDDFDDDAGNDDFDDFDDCAMMADGQCLKAGTEECDWECGRWRG